MFRHIGKSMLSQWSSFEYEFSWLILLYKEKVYCAFWTARRLVQANAAPQKTGSAMFLNLATFTLDLDLNLPQYTHRLPLPSQKHRFLWNDALFNHELPASTTTQPTQPTINPSITTQDSRQHYALCVNNSSRNTHVIIINHNRDPVVVVSSGILDLKT